MSENVNDSNNLLNRFNDEMFAKMNDNMKSSFCAQNKDQESQPLTIEALQNAMNKCKRELKHIYIMSSKFIPDDCYGILMVRPEDAENWKTISNK